MNMMRTVMHTGSAAADAAAAAKTALVDAVNALGSPATPAQLTAVEEKQAAVLAAAAANPVTVGAPLAAGTAFLYGTPFGNALAAGRTGAQKSLREIEREVRRQVPRTGRELISGYARTGVVNYADD
jgi:hypothetical protein